MTVKTVAPMIGTAQASKAEASEEWATAVSDMDFDTAVFIPESGVNNQLGRAADFVRRLELPVFEKVEDEMGFLVNGSIVRDAVPGTFVVRHLAAGEEGGFSDFVPETDGVLVMRQR